MARGELQTEDEADEAESHVDRALAAFGLLREPAADPDDGRFYLWPELVPALRLWSAVQTQWRVSVIGAVAAGMGAAPVSARTGLDYQGVEVVMRRRGIRGRQADEMFALMQAMERAALAAWAEMRDAA